MKLWLLVASFLFICSACVASETFKDVPGDHWAAESVKAVSEAGIMRGYPDTTFNGEKHVTRYELAVALANFVEYVKNTEKPLVSEISLTPSQHWGQRSVDYLRDNMLVPEDSIILTDGCKPITQDELARTLASIGAQLIALRMPSTDDNK